MKKPVLFLLLGGFVLCALFAPAWPSAFAQDTGRADESAEPPGDESAPAGSDGEAEAASGAAGGVAGEEEEPGEIYFFLGRFHPIALHSPIGILSALFLFELIALLFLRGQFRERNAGRWVLLTLGSGSAVVAATLGVFLSWSASYNEDLIFWHQWTGIAVAVAAVVAWSLRALYERSQDSSYNLGYIVSLSIAVAVLMPAGHFGAGLTHGTDYLTKYLPEPIAFLAPILGEAKAAETVADDSIFGNRILPILESKCFECHSNEKQDGELRMDSLDACLAGGESGSPSIVQGDAMASYMVELMLLPEENEDVMPPRGKPKLTPEETLTLIEWVNRGAPWGDYEAPEPVVVAVSKLDPNEVDPADMEPKPLVEMADTMKLFFEERFNELRAGLVEEPKGRSRISAVYNATYSLAEAHNLLFELDEDDFMETDEWAAYAVQGRQLSGAIGEALKASDYPLMKEHFVALVESCNGCHQEFSPDVDTVLLVAPAEEVEEPAEEEESGGRRGRRGRRGRN